MVSAIIIDGFLLKKKKQEKKSFLASKYQRRWFELTSDTLTYCKDPKELKDGSGEIEVFSVHELAYIKKLEDEKLEMKFPERVLRVKAESKMDFERWYQAIKRAHNAKMEGINTPQAKQLDNFARAQVKQFSIMTAGEDEYDTSLARPQTPPKKAPAEPNRPPSPRSLLANPKMGNMIISTPSKAQPSDDDGESAQPAPRKGRWSDDSDEEPAQPASKGAQGQAQTGSKTSLPAQTQGPEQQQQQQKSDGAPSTQRLKLALDEPPIAPQSPACRPPSRDTPGGSDRVVLGASAPQDVSVTASGTAAAAIAAANHGHDAAGSASPRNRGLPPLHPQPGGSALKLPAHSEVPTKPGALSKSSSLASRGEQLVLGHTHATGSGSGAPTPSGSRPGSNQQQRNGHAGPAAAAVGHSGSAVSSASVSPVPGARSRHGTTVADSDEEMEEQAPQRPPDLDEDFDSSDDEGEEEEQQQQQQQRKQQERKPVHDSDAAPSANVRAPLHHSVQPSTPVMGMQRGVSVAGSSSSMSSSRPGSSGPEHMPLARHPAAAPALATAQAHDSHMDEGSGGVMSSRKPRQGAQQLQVPADDDNDEDDDDREEGSSKAHGGNKEWLEDDWDSSDDDDGGDEQEGEGNAAQGKAHAAAQSRAALAAAPKPPSAQHRQQQQQQQSSPMAKPPAAPAAPLRPSRPAAPQAVGAAPPKPQHQPQPPQQQEDFDDGAEDEEGNGSKSKVDADWDEWDDE